MSSVGLFISKNESDPSVVFSSLCNHYRSRPGVHLTNCVVGHLVSMQGSEVVVDHGDEHVTLMMRRRSLMTPTRNMFLV